MVEEPRVEVVIAPCNFLQERGGFVQAICARDVEVFNVLLCLAAADQSI
jgi:hypothetical protein